MQVIRRKIRRPQVQSATVVQAGISNNVGGEKKAEFIQEAMADFVGRMSRSYCLKDAAEIRNSK